MFVILFQRSLSGPLMILLVSPSALDVSWWMFSSCLKMVPTLFFARLCCGFRIVSWLFDWLRGFEGWV